MFSQFGPSTWIALLLGTLLAIAGFVPFAVLRYRKAGRLRLVDVVTLLAVAVYGVALWTYTLVPLPESDDFRCAGTNLRPFEFVRDILATGRNFWRSFPAFQALFNVVLFVPLGFFVRTLLRRGVVVAGLAGFAISLAIELTQRTGIWGYFHCAYRVFDVDDLILNTSGAVVGSLLTIPIMRLLGPARPLPAVIEVTLGRRLIGMLADAALVTIVGGGLVIAWRAVALYVLGVPFADLPPAVETVLAVVPALVLESWWVLRRGRTFGEAAVQLEPVVTHGHVLGPRLVKLASGVGGYIVLSGVESLAWATGPFVLVTLVAAWRSRHHRGLSHMAAGMDLRIEQVPGSPRPPATP